MTTTGRLSVALAERYRFSVFLAVFAVGCSSAHPSSGPGAQRSITTDSIAFEVTEVTRVAFDVTPDGRSLIIDLLGQLWRVPSSGGDAVAITNAARDTAEDMDPAVSRDGHTIVFQSDRPGGRGLWLLRNFLRDELAGLEVDEGEAKLGRTMFETAE